MHGLLVLWCIATAYFGGGDLIGDILCLLFAVCAFVSHRARASDATPFTDHRPLAEQRGGDVHVIEAVSVGDLAVTKQGVSGFHAAYSLIVSGE